LIERTKPCGEARENLTEQYEIVMPSNNQLTATEPGFTLWFTGLPCAGKSTLAREMGFVLLDSGYPVEILDGDVVRTSLCKGLGFSREDRDENISRIGWACALLNKHGVVAISAAVSPYRAARDQLRIDLPRFVEVYVKAPLSVCMQRDVKGMYAKAMAGSLPHFTGIDDPYDEPLAPDIIVETHTASISQCVGSIVEHLEKLGLLTFASRPQAESFSTRSL
jgi:adenylylsulfate kinase